MYIHIHTYVYMYQPHIHKGYEPSIAPHTQYPTYPYGEAGCRTSAVSIWYIGNQIAPISIGHSGHWGNWISNIKF